MLYHGVSNHAVGCTFSARKPKITGQLPDIVVHIPRLDDGDRIIIRPENAISEHIRQFKMRYAHALDSVPPFIVPYDLLLK